MPEALLTDEQVGLAAPTPAAPAVPATDELLSDVDVGIAREEQPRLALPTGRVVQFEPGLREPEPSPRWAATKEMALGVPEAIGVGTGAAGKALVAGLGRAAFGTGDTLEDVRAAVETGAPLPIEQAAEKLPGARGLAAKIGLGFVETVPKIGALALFPGSIWTQTVAAGGIFGVSPQGDLSAKSAVVGMLLPGAGSAARAGVARALTKGIESGAGILENRTAQYLFGELAHQAALNTVMLAFDTPELLDLYRRDPEAAKKQVQEIVGQNLAWSLFGAYHHFVRGGPTGAEDFILKNRKKYADIADRMITRRLAGKEGQEAIADAIEEAKKRQREAGFGSPETMEEAFARGIVLEPPAEPPTGPPAPPTGPVPPRQPPPGPPAILPPEPAVEKGPSYAIQERSPETIPVAERAPVSPQVGAQVRGGEEPAVPRPAEVQEAPAPTVEPEKLTTPAISEKPPDYPPIGPIPTGLSQERLKVEFDRRKSLIDDWFRELTAWEQAQPANRPILFEDDHNVFAITPNVGKPGWRTTRISKADRMLVAHEEYNTRAEAVRDRVRDNNRLIAKMPFAVEPLRPAAPEVPKKANDLVPAFEDVGGMTLPGSKGQTHNEIWNAQPIDWRADNFEKMLEGRGFLAVSGPLKGKFFTRREAANYLNEKEELHSERLFELQKAEDAAIVPPAGAEAPGTITVRTGPEPGRLGEVTEEEKASTRGEEREAKPPMTAGPEELVPGRGAAAPAVPTPAEPEVFRKRADIRKDLVQTKDDLKSARQKLQRMEKANITGPEYTRQERKVVRLSNRVTELDAELSRAQAAAPPPKTKTGRLWSEAYAEMPPDIITDLEDATRINVKLSLKDVRERYDPNFRPTGMLRPYFVLEGGLSVDQALTSLQQAGEQAGARRSKYADLSASDFLEQLQAAAIARKRWLENYRKEKEPLKEEAQLIEFQKQSVKEGKAREPYVVGDEVNVGDEFTIAGTKLKVTDIRFDENGEVLNVEFDDGNRYGTQRLENQTVLNIDKGSLKKKEGTTEFLPAGEEPAPPATKPEEPEKPALPPPKVTPRPLTKAEQKEFEDLTWVFRDWREKGGAPPTTEQTQRYEYLGALAGQMDLLAEQAKTGLVERMEALRAKAAEMNRLRLRTEDRAWESKFRRKELLDEAKTYQLEEERTRDEIRRLQQQLEGKGPMEQAGFELGAPPERPTPPAGEDLFAAPAKPKELPSEKPPTPISAGKEGATERAGAAVGASVGRYMKHSDGRWYMTEEDGTIRLKENGKPSRIPANKDQTRRLEEAAARPAPPPDTRTPIEIINQARVVDVTPANPGDTMLRMTDERGRQSTISLEQFKKYNPFRQANAVKLESGIINSERKFQPSAGEVRVSERIEPAAELGRGLPEGEGMRSEDEVLKAVEGVDTIGFPINVITRDRAVEITGQTQAQGYGGFYWDGQIYLVRDNISRDPAFLPGVKSLLREEVGHGLLRTEPGMRMLREVLIQGRLNLTQEERQALLDLGYQEHQLLDEFIAKSARENLPWWREIVERVRVFLSKIGLVGLTNDETARLLLRQIRVELSGQAKAPIGLPLNEVAPGEPVGPTPEGERPGGERMGITQVSGEKIGVERPMEYIAGIRERIRTGYFNGTQPVEEGRTANAWEIAQRFTNPESRASYANQIAAQGGGDMAPEILRNEIWDYSVRMALRGDPRLMRFMVERSHDFESLDSEAHIGLTQVGRALRAARERAMGGLWRRLVTYTKEQRALVGEELSLGRQGLEEIISSIDGLITQTTRDVDAFEREILTGDKGIQRILDETSAERKAAEEISGTAKFVTPERRATILETVYQWMRQEVDPAIDQTRFTDTLKAELQRLRLTPEQAQTIADATWNRKLTVDGEVRRKLWDRELRRLDNLAEKTAQQFMLRVEEAEWTKPKQPNEVRDIIKEALKSQEPLDPNNLLGFKRSLKERLITAGLAEPTAQRLSDAISQKREGDLLNSQMRIRDRAARATSLKSLIESIRSSPYLAQKDPAWRLETARLWFESNGVPKERAIEAAKMFDAQFVNALTRAAERAARRLLTKGEFPRTIPELVEAVRLGLTDPDKSWIEEIANRKGFRPLSREDQTRLAQLEQKFADPKLGPHEQVALVEQMLSITRHAGSPKGQLGRLMGESFSASLLSGIRTGTLNFLQPWTALISQYATHAIAEPRDFPTLTRALFNAAKIWWPEIKFAWTKDAYAFIAEEKVYHHNELKRIFEQANKDWETGKYTKAITEYAFGWQQYVIRALQTADQASMAVSREWKLALYGSMAMREAGLSTKQIADLVDVTVGFKRSAYQQALAEGKTTNEADVIADEAGRDGLINFFENKLGSRAKADQVAEAALYDSFSLVGRRAPKIEETDEGFLSRYSGMNWVMRRVSEARREGGGASILTILAVGFMNVPLRTARYFAGFSPYGLLRYGIDKYRTNRGLETFWKQSFANELQSKARLREALAGTALMMGFLGWQTFNSTADEDVERKKFGMFVTGNGPTNRTLRDAWLKRGFEPYCLHVIADGRVMSKLPITRVGQVFSFPLGLAAAADDVAWKLKEETAIHGQPRDVAGRDLLAAIATYYNIVGAQGVFQSFSHVSQVASGTRGTGRAIGVTAASTAAALGIPGKSLINSVADMIVGPVDRSSTEAAMAANFPVLNALWNGLAINRFGDQVTDRTWSARLSKLGIPILFRVQDTPENKALYQMILEKGAAPPDLRRYVVEEKYGPLDQDQWNRYVKVNGDSLKRTVLDNLDSLNGMEPTAVKQFMNRAAEIAGNEAAAAVNLVPQKVSQAGAPVGTAGPSAQALPRIPSAGAPTAVSGAGGVPAGGGRAGTVPFPTYGRAGGRISLGAGPRRVAPRGVTMGRLRLSRGRATARRLVTGRLRPYSGRGARFGGRMTRTAPYLAVRRRRLTLKG